MAQLLVLHGPNLNLLGTREPAVYGRTTLAQIDADLRARTEAAGHAYDSLQSNAEHVLVDRIQAARSDGTAFIVINPAAFTHTSVAIRDALAAVAISANSMKKPRITKRIIATNVPAIDRKKVLMTGAIPLLVLESGLSR